MIGISIHAPRVGSDGHKQGLAGFGRDFNPRSPCGERQSVEFEELDNDDISIHAPRVGSDQNCNTNAKQHNQFQSTLPVWGATLAPRLEFLGNGVFQSTLPVWGATNGDMHKALNYAISIHAPRVGSDLSFGRPKESLGISIHAPRVGSDLLLSPPSRGRGLFQSTLPVWGATLRSLPVLIALFDFNPRSPCGERPYAPPTGLSTGSISIHAPRVAMSST